MSYSISKIELVFENLESITIAGEYIEDIGMVEVTDMVNIRANEVHFDENVECMFIRISEAANVEYATDPDGEKGTVFERVIKYRDICSITLCLEDTGTGRMVERYYSVPWDGTCDENLRQRTVFEGGSLLLYIE